MKTILKYLIINLSLFILNFFDLESKEDNYVLSKNIKIKYGTIPINQLPIVQHSNKSIKLININPNPVYNNFWIEINMNIDKIEIFNVYGDKLEIFECSGGGQFFFDIDHYRNGFYIVLLTFKNYIVAKGKFVKL